MRLCRVLGEVVSSAHHADYDGATVLVVCPEDESGHALVGSEFVAVDHSQAGVGDRVLVLNEGLGVRQVIGRDVLAIGSVVVAVVDAVEVV